MLTSTVYALHSYVLFGSVFSCCVLKVKRPSRVFDPFVQFVRPSRPPRPDFASLKSSELDCQDNVMVTVVSRV